MPTNFRELSHASQALACSLKIAHSCALDGMPIIPYSSTATPITVGVRGFRSSENTIELCEEVQRLRESGIDAAVMYCADKFRKFAIVKKQKE